MSSKATEKPIFKGLTIAIAGQLGGQFNADNIERWVRQRAGQFSSDMNDTVTHVLCSPAEFQKKGTRVAKAMKRGAKACHIVTKDWFEDSVMKKRKLSERHFLLTKALRDQPAKVVQETDEKRENIIQETKVAKELELSEHFIHAGRYRVFMDNTGFSYEVTITRRDEELCVSERCILYLYESCASPHLYWFGAKCYQHKGDNQPQLLRPSDTCGLFVREFDHFKAFFKEKTGIPWDRRLNPSRKEDKSLFCYEVPTGGKPVGHVAPVLKTADTSSPSSQAVLVPNPETVIITVAETAEMIVPDDAVQYEKYDMAGFYQQ